MAVHERLPHPKVPMLVLLLWAALPACTPPAPVAGPTEVIPVAFDELPPGARFADIGGIGQAYRLRATHSADARFPAPEQLVSRLLPSTVRLFRFDEQRGVWTEIADSRLDESTRELVGTGLTSGLYTAFGWSAHPAENVLQRLIFDAQRGFRNDQVAFASVDELRQGIASISIEQRPQLIRDFVQLSVSLDQTTCRLADEATLAECPEACRALARPSPRAGAWGFCPRECPQPGCCDCESFRVTERVWIPASMIRTPLQPCPGWQNGQPCPLCLDGLSCPTRPVTPDAVIAPNLPVLDYSVMHRARLAALAEDTVLRTAWHAAVEQVLGRRYGDPSPQPSQ